MRVPVSLQPQEQSVWTNFGILAKMIGKNDILLILICISLIVSKVENLSMLVEAIFMSFFVNFFFSIF